MEFILVVHVLFSVIHFSLQGTTSTSFFRSLSGSSDACAFEVYTLNFNSKILCALFCAEDLLCNAFDTCLADNEIVCHLRYGEATIMNENPSTPNCEHFEMITKTSCEDGFFLRSHGICKNNNLALHSPTAMSSVFNDPVYAHQRHGNGSLAVNGEVRSDDKECAVTNKELKPFLTIDLLDNFYVGRVVSTNRYYAEYRLHDLNVTVGRDGSKFDCFCGFFKGPGTRSQRVDMVCQDYCRGRYVRLQIVSDYPEFLQLCEVEVYSNCNL